MSLLIPLQRLFFQNLSYNKVAALSRAAAEDGKWFSICMRVPGHFLYFYGVPMVGHILRNCVCIHMD